METLVRSKYHLRLSKEPWKRSSLLISHVVQLSAHLVFLLAKVQLSPYQESQSIAAVFYDFLLLVSFPETSSKRLKMRRMLKDMVTTGILWILAAPPL